MSLSIAPIFPDVENVTPWNMQWIYCAFTVTATGGSTFDYWDLLVNGVSKSTFAQSPALGSGTYVQPFNIVWFNLGESNSWQVGIRDKDTLQWVYSDPMYFTPHWAGGEGPENPTKTYPTDYQEEVELDVTLTWDAATYIEGYRLIVDVYSGGSWVNIIDTRLGDITEYLLENLYSWYSYRWDVIGYYEQIYHTKVTSPYYTYYEYLDSGIESWQYFTTGIEIYPDDNESLLWSNWAEKEEGDPVFRWSDFGTPENNYTIALRPIEEEWWDSWITTGFWQYVSNLVPPEYYPLEPNTYEWQLGYFDLEEPYEWHEIGIFTFTIEEEEEEPPAKPINPIPANNAEDISIFLNKLQWEDGDPENPADSYDIYFAKIGQSLVKLGSTSGLNFPVPSWLLISTNYYWRVDAVNEAGTTTGDIWYFTTRLYTGFIRCGYTLDEDTVSDVTADEDGFLYTSGNGHVAGDLYYSTLRKIDPDTGEVIWTSLPLNNGLYPGKICYKNGFIYTTGPTHPRKFDATTGAELLTYSNIYGDGGVGVNNDGYVFSCGPMTDGKNIWKSDAAGTSQISKALGSGTLRDLLVVTVDSTNYIFVCGDYDETQDADVWKLDINLNIIEKYKTGYVKYNTPPEPSIISDSKRIIQVPGKEKFWVLHSKAFDLSGIVCHVTEFNYNLTVTNRIYLSKDMEYQDFDQYPEQEGGALDLFPPDILRIILTDKRCLGGLELSYLDFESLGKMLQYCEENNIKLSIVLEAQKPLLDWIDFVNSHYLGYTFMGGE